MDISRDPHFPKAVVVVIVATLRRFLEFQAVRRSVGRSFQSVLIS